MWIRRVEIELSGRQNKKKKAAKFGVKLLSTAHISVFNFCSNYLSYTTYRMISDVVLL